MLCACVSIFHCFSLNKFEHLFYLASNASSHSQLTACGRGGDNVMESTSPAAQRPNSVGTAPSPTSAVNVLFTPGVEWRQTWQIFQIELFWFLLFFLNLPSPWFDAQATSWIARRCLQVHWQRDWRKPRGSWFVDCTPPPKSTWTSSTPGQGQVDKWNCWKACNCVA